LGDWLDKPLGSGGMAMSRYTASAALLLIMVVLIVVDSRMQRRSSLNASG
jgi:uncharacterized membrane-anchored protein